MPIVQVGEIRVQLYKEQFAEMIFFAEFEVGQVGKCYFQFDYFI